MVYALKLSAPGGSGPGSGGAYERLTSGDSFTSNLLVINLMIVVVLFVLSNVAMYLGAERNPEGGSRVPIRFFTLVAAVAGVYAISPLAEFPFLYMRYIMMLVMVLATLAAFVTYLREQAELQVRQPGAKLPGGVARRRDPGGDGGAQHGLHEVQLEGALHGI